VELDLLEAREGVEAAAQQAGEARAEEVRGGPG
jgi:hypothetical protein